MADIEIRLMELRDYDRVLDFLRIHYYREEPLTAGSEPKQQDSADEEFNMSNIVHGTCLMAIKTGDGDGDCSSEGHENIVGALMSGPKGRNEAEHLFQEAATIPNTKWGKILRFLAKIERDADLFSKYDIDRALHVHVVGVDARLRGQSIGIRLMQGLMTVARQLGYPIISADCTSTFSAYMCDRLNMICINVQRYSDYLDEDGQQVFRPPEPHKSVRTYAKLL